MNWPSERQFFAFAAGVVLGILLLTDCAGAPKKLGHSPQFAACRDMCMANGASEALVLEKAEGIACVCVKAPEKT